MPSDAPAGLQPEERVIWRRVTRGGYGYVQRVPGTVLVVRAGRVKIRVCTASGAPVDRWVRLENLRRPTRGK